MCPSPWLHTSLDDIRLQVITIPPTAEFSALLILVNQRHVSPASSFIYKGDLIILRRVSTSACFSRSSNRHFCLFWLFTHLARSSKDFQWPRKPSCVCLRWLMGFKKQVYHPCSRVPYHFPFLRYDAGNNNKVYHNTFIPGAGFFFHSLSWDMQIQDERDPPTLLTLPTLSNFHLSSLWQKKPQGQSL